MALDGSGGAYYRANSTFSNTVNLHTGYVMHVWVRASAVPSSANVRTVCGLIGTSGTQNPQDQIHWNHTAAGFSKASIHRNSAGTYINAQSATTPSADTWYSWIAHFDGTNVRTYLNGTLEGTSAAGAFANSAGAVNVDLMAAITTAGALDSSSQFAIGQIAEFCIWKPAITLTADERASLAKGLRPNRVRPAEILLYAPCVRSLNDLRDSRTFTKLAGTDAFSDHPRVYG